MTILFVNTEVSYGRETKFFEKIDGLCVLPTFQVAKLSTMDDWYGFFTKIAFWKNIVIDSGVNGEIRNSQWLIAPLINELIDSYKHRTFSLCKRLEITLRWLVILKTSQQRDSKTVFCTEFQLNWKAVRCALPQ